MKTEPKVVEDITPNIIYLSQKRYKHFGKYIIKVYFATYLWRTIRIDNLELLKELILYSNKK